MMGSATVIDSKPTLPMAEYTDKKSIKNILKKPFQALFKDKKKEKKREKDAEKTEEPCKVVLPPPKVTPVATLLENFRKLEIEKKKQTESENNETQQVTDDKTQTEEDADEEDEFKDFTIQIVEEDRRNERIDSHSSQDSGFSEKATHSDDEKEKEKDKDMVESLKNLSIDNRNEKKKKKLQTIIVSRAPIRRQGGYSNTPHPYIVGQDSDSHKQINQVNKQTFSGGQVIVNSNQTVTDNYSEIGRALTQIEMNVQTFAQNSRQDQDDWWDVAQEFLNEKSTPRSMEMPDDILSGFSEVQVVQESFDTINNFVSEELSEPNPIEEFTNTTHTEFEQIETLDLPSIPTYIQDDSVPGTNDKTYIYPTPPRSENVPSPMSDSQVSSLFYASPNSEHTFSPERSSPIYNSDYEKYQEIAQLDDQYPSCVSESMDEKSQDKQKTRERNSSSSSMTMKQFKDLQKKISTGFSKKDCCQISRKPCREIFQECIQKLAQDDRKRLCCKVASLDLRTAYGVLHHIILALSKSTDEEDLQYALFSLICEKIMALKPALFVGDFGLSLIKSAALRCYRRPLLTRYLVQCVRTALRVDAVKVTGKESVFHEVDALGDTLLIACARAGDACGDVLAELVRREPEQTPLFNVYHANADGYSALHVACSEHSASSKRLHVVHVLLEHGGADLWKGDVKGGDTALHLAVNSVHCDLDLIMIMFRHVDRKMWKQLAHAQNRSSVTPLEYARSATKSTIRHNYPHEVLDFLKKCR